MLVLLTNNVQQLDFEYMKGTHHMPVERPDPGVELPELICFDLYAASRALTATYRPLLSKLRLTYPQYLVLTVLWQNQKPTTLKQLSDVLQLDHNTLDPLLHRMQSNGLITRQRRLEDERTVSIGLTPNGAALRAHARRIQNAIRAAVGLDDQQAAALHTTLKSVTASARGTRNSDVEQSSSPALT